MSVFPQEKGGMISTRGLTAQLGIQLREAERRGELLRLKNGVYARPEALADTMLDFDLIVPGGVLCLWSAWSVYGLTTQIPNGYTIAIERSRKIVLPSSPPIQLIYQSRSILSLGKIQKEIQGHDVAIFDLERSVCDAIKYRHKIGIDVMAEILRTYLSLPEKQISRLMGYAEKLRVAKTLKKYLEVWQ